MNDMPESTGELDVLELLDAPIPADELQHQIGIWTNVSPTERTGVWMPSDESEAEWAALKLRAAQREEEQRVDALEAYRAKIDRAIEWECTNGRVGQLRRTIAFMTDRLERWAMLRRLQGPRDKHGQPKIKTVMLPSARIETRKVKRRHAHVEIVDENQLIEWAETWMPESVVKHVDQRAFREYVLPHRDDDGKDDQRMVFVPSGAIVPGVLWHPAEEDVAATVRLVEDDRENDQ